MQKNPYYVSQWVVGAQCRAVWSVDGKEYPATVVSVDGNNCRVHFTGYGNEEDMELSALKSPNATPQMENSHAQVNALQHIMAIFNGLKCKSVVVLDSSAVKS